MSMLDTNYAKAVRWSALKWDRPTQKAGHWYAPLQGNEGKPRLRYAYWWHNGKATA